MNQDGTCLSPSLARTTDRAPGCYPRRVLLAVSGLSPQIITETLYALAVAAEPAERFVPTEIHVLTTVEGARRVQLALLSDQPGGFHALRRDYGLPDICFGPAQIHQVQGTDGQPLPDIRSESDNALMADAITDLVRELTADPDSALHVSMAGGRKTMGYYAGYALSLFGRAQDRLSHVLVSAPFESSLEFFYPTPQPRLISVPGGALADASQAQISLAHIPFVRLRHVLPADMLQGGAGFAAAVQAADRRLGPPRLVIDVAAQAIEADGQCIALPPWQFALMAVLAQRACLGKPPLPAPEAKDGNDRRWAADVLADLQAALGLMQMPDAVVESLRLACCGNTVSPHWSRLRKRLAGMLGAGRVALYFDDGGTQRHKRYRVPLEAGAIEIRRADAVG